MTELIRLMLHALPGAKKGKKDLTDLRNNPINTDSVAQKQGPGVDVKKQIRVCFIMIYF